MPKYKDYFKNTLNEEQGIDISRNPEDVKFSDEFFQDYCVENCKYFNGLGSGIGAVECLYDDKSNMISVTVDPSAKKKVKLVIGRK